MYSPAQVNRYTERAETQTVRQSDSQTVRQSDRQTDKLNCWLHNRPALRVFRKHERAPPTSLLLSFGWIVSQSLTLSVIHLSPAIRLIL